MERALKYFLLFLVISSLSYAQETNDKVKLSGLMFGDYFYNIDNKDAAKKDLNGFQFRRIYITTDYEISSKFATRFRLEADQGSNSLTPGGKVGVMVKDAYLKWKGFLNSSELVFGISPTPAFSVSESAWGYRSLEKTTMDLFHIVSSRDLGIDLKGNVLENGNIKYWVKIGNNSGNSPEVDKYKRYYAMFQFKPSQNFQATVYGDYASRAQVTDPSNGQDKSNNQLVSALFLNYFEKNTYSIGLETFYQSVQNDFSTSPTQALQNRTGFGISVFGWVKVHDNLRLVGRFDNYDPNNDLSNDATSFVLAGIDYRPDENVSIIPNFELFSYQGTDNKDLIGRITFYYNF